MKRSNTEVNSRQPPHREPRVLAIGTSMSVLGATTTVYAVAHSRHTPKGKAAARCWNGLFFMRSDCVVETRFSLISDEAI
jgi:hypothetical protein